MALSGKRDTAPNPFFIRECRPEEAETLLALRRAAGISPSVTDTPADIPGAIESTAFVLIAEAEQRGVGSLIATFDR